MDKQQKETLTADELQQLRDRELKWVINTLWDIAEAFYPNYYSSDDIAKVDDIYKKYFDK